MENKEENSKNTDKEMEKRSANWGLILFYIYIHFFAIMGFYLMLSKAKWMTIFFFIFIVTIASIGLTAGAHRLYAHRAFAMSLELKFFIMIAHTLAGVGSIQNWVFWHRIHHKYYGTEKDPYNHNKGFFYSHVYSNLLSAPSDLDTYIKSIDMRDIEDDKFVWIQHKFYWILFVLGFVIPIYLSMEYWNESLLNSFVILGIVRLMITTNISWLVNSAKLIWGLNKEDKFPVNDNSIFFLWKSYWMNYHYMIPWDWKNDEFGHYEKGFITFIIKMWRELGLVSDMMTVCNKKLQELLYKVALSEITMNDALEQIKADATDNIMKERLIYYH